MNSFQCILGTDGSESFAVFLYADGITEWIADYGQRDDMLYNPIIGFIDDFGGKNALLTGSDIENVLTTSNTGIAGVWVLQIDTAMIRQNHC